MGSPNLGAIEEFERVNERYTFLTGQRDDIEKARDELLQIVSELTGEMENIFRVEFEAVARSFSETFTELFGGGRGELILEDPNDILNCGIEIRVQRWTRSNPPWMKTTYPASPATPAVCRTRPSSSSSPTAGAAWKKRTCFTA